MPAIYKVCLIGPEGVGKTSLVRRFTEGGFKPEYLKTLGVTVSKKQVSPDPSAQGEPVDLIIWDIMGSYELFDEVAEAYLTGANGILAVLDVTRPETLPGLERWWQTARGNLREPEGAIAANKVDLAAQRRVGEEELAGLAERLGWSCFETSALDGTGVRETFRSLASSLISR